MNTGSGTNWFAAVALHWTGGLASASFYLPFRGVKRWSWETYWLVGGFFSWIVAPLVFAYFLVPDFWQAIHTASASTLFWTYFFGVLWGLGGLTFGLTMRYLGIGLGMAIALSYCAAFGTMVPPLFDGSIKDLAAHFWGWVTMAGVLVCLVGIAMSGAAGWAKEQELPAEQRRAVVKEFNFRKGILVATFSGVMSACFNFGYGGLKGLNEVHGENPLTAAGATILKQHHASLMWSALPTLIVLLWGGFTTNFVWCLILHLRNRSSREYIASTSAADENRILTGLDGPGYSEPVGNIELLGNRVPLLSNYALSAIAGVLWYLQFFFYTAGQSFMPKVLAFSGWTLHMASIIIFATLWGVILHEWKGTSKKTHALIAIGVAVLVLSTIIVGAGSYLKTKAPAKPTKPSAALAVPQRAA